MPNAALIVFAIAAPGGVVLAAHVWRNKFAPWALSILHALLGAAGLLLIALLLRLDHLAPLAPTVASFALDAAGFTVLAVGGWFGGRLVHGHGIGRA